MQIGLSRPTKIKILLVLDIAFFLAELIIGYTVNSLALVADSFHMLNDVLSLVVSLYAIKFKSTKGASDRYSYGWHRAEVLAALVNGVFLLALCFSIVTEALQRLFSHPNVSNPKLVVIVGCFGLASNVFGLFLFHEHGPPAKLDEKKEDIDLEAAGQARDPADIALESVEDVRTDSLVDFPQAVRARVIQAAENLHRARTSSELSCVHSYRRSNDVTTDITEYKDDPEQDAAVLISQPGSSTAPLTRQMTWSSQRRRHEETHATHEAAQAATKKGHSHSHSHGDGGMNMRSLVLHVFGDALGNLGVIATGLIIWLTHFGFRFHLDPLVSLVITVIIFSSALPLVKSTSFILLQGVPPGISLQDVEHAIRAVEGVKDVHELHLWQLSEKQSVGSVHVHVVPGYSAMKVATDIRRAVHDHGIHSMTVQPEFPENHAPDISEGCLIPCPPGGTSACDPMENACCPPEGKQKQ